MEDGLPENTVTAMVEAPDGYLWISTFSGLARFDGKHFKVYDRSITTNLPSSQVVGIHRTRRGQLLISTIRGMAVMEGDAFISLGAEAGWREGYARTLSEGPAGTVLVTTFDGRVLTFDGRRFTELPEPPGRKNEGYFGHMDRSNRVWVAQTDFLGHWDGQRWQALPLPAGWRTNFVGAGPARDGGWWLAETDRIHQFADGRILRTLRLRGVVGDCWGIHEDRQGQLWLSTIGGATNVLGVLRVEPDGKVAQFSVRVSMAFETPRFVYQDREGSYWVGTAGGGLMRWRERSVQMIAGNTGLSGRNINGVATHPEGGMVLGSFYESGGLYWYRDGKATSIPVPGVTNAVFVQSALTDRKGRTWIATLQEGLLVLERGAVRSMAIPLQPKEWIVSLDEDSRGRIWVGHQRGLSCIDGESLRQREIEIPSGLCGALAFAEDTNQGVTWSVTEAGLFRWREGGSIEEVRRPDGRSFDSLTSVRLDKGGRLWLSTTTHGMLILDRGRLSSLTEADGLPGHVYGEIVEDDSGFWWLLSNQGLLRFRPEEWIDYVHRRRSRPDYRLFDGADGMASTQFTHDSSPTACRDGEGRIWIASGKGAAWIDPGKVPENRTPPPVVIHAVHVNGRLWGLGTTGTEDRPARFPAGTRRLEFHYAALSFAAPEKNRFLRHLEGRDQGWEWVRGEDSLVWDAPQPGRYRLRVRACNNDGVWNEVGAELAFVVEVHFWQTWWFRIAALLGFGGLIGTATYGVSWTRLRRQRERLEQELRFRSVFNSTFQHMALLSVDGTVLEANETSLQSVGASRADVVGRPFWEAPWWAHSAELRDQLREAIRKAAAGERVRLQTSHPSPEGRFAWVDFSLTPIRDSRGRVTYLVPEGRDITDIKDAEKKVHQLNAELEQRVAERTSQLKEANQELEAFCYSVSHDLRSPLRAINGFSTILAEDCDSLLNEDGHTCLRRIIDNTRRMEHLIDDLLSLSRVTQTALRPAQVNLSALAAAAVEHLRAAEPERSVRVTIALDVSASADEGLLRIALENLLGNAWKYTRGRDPARIEFGSRQQQEETVYFVRDNGVGFNMEHSRRLFRPFERLHSGEDFPGTGIGLAIVQRIVQRHSGRVWAEAVPDGGATFSFTLPPKG